MAEQRFFLVEDKTIKNELLALMKPVAIRDVCAEAIRSAATHRITNREDNRLAMDGFDFFWEMTKVSSEIGRSSKQALEQKIKEVTKWTATPAGLKQDDIYADIYIEQPGADVFLYQDELYITIPVDAFPDDPALYKTFRSASIPPESDDAALKRKFSHYARNSKMFDAAIAWRVPAGLKEVSPQQMGLKEGNITTMLNPFPVKVTCSAHPLNSGMPTPKI